MENLQKEGIKPDVLTYVPLHFLRQGKRGFNQSKLLGEYIAEKMGIPLIGSMTKIKNTAPLSKAKHENRSRLVKGAYKIKSKAVETIRGKTVLLIDDIMTTGATISECTRVLKCSGAKTVFCAAIASTPKSAGIIR